MFDAMKPVLQREATGCGIASVATLAGVTYRHARRAAEQFGISVQDDRLWSDTAYVRTLLRHYGVRALDKEQPFHSWEALPDLALLAIKWRMESSRAFWHWVVFWRGPHGAVVLDPKRSLRTHRRTDFGRMKPKWFIEISDATVSHRNRRARTKTECFSPD
jgi:ABC-type bacteriocin/lantibiotic exporter with double-glycine peptidase domain